MKHIVAFQLFEKRELKERWETELSEKEFKLLYKANCKAHAKVRKKTLIFRRDQHISVPFAKLEPKINEHWNVQNYESVIIDHLPCFDMFPKRGKSVMAANDVTRFMERSLDNLRKRPDAYVMIPFDNALIGVCPMDDFWTSFDHTPGPLNTVFDDIDAFFKVGTEDEFLSYEDMKQRVTPLNDKKIDEIYNNAEHNLIAEMFKKQNDDVFTFDKFMKYLNDFFKADVKNFGLTRYNQYFKVKLYEDEDSGIGAEGHEIWTEGPVLVAQLAMYEKLFGKIDYYFGLEDEEEFVSKGYKKITIDGGSTLMNILHKRVLRIDPNAQMSGNEFILSKPFQESDFMISGGLRAWGDKVKFS